MPLPECAAPVWYRDAVIYQLHVRAFYDSNGDGIGDLPGLIQKLDYIQELGVTAIWMLPLFPSPLKDDGYDISDYYSINPMYGDLDDFKRLLKEAHRRGLKVITELVMNHTSDQHAWFQKSRRAKPGDPWRDFYVWSDDPHRYSRARVIFKDYESSNWSWDEKAGAYYWHRFYHHQPDLNFENPEVRAEMLRVLDFWLDLGVDGLRLDAVPYLFEEEGTNCENRPATHGFLKELRAHFDVKYDDRLILAEANQWPEDAAAYFGAGDECHMNFHFPLMPRLFMAVEREDRFPIIDILEQTPDLPDGCQWAIFLRNHDELTLEMVTDEERDYMYRAYAQDPRARVNLGIRRRLAPLMRDDRRKIELLNVLLLSLPGTPILYYGDEIRMGDNFYLGDRDAVRTPMQWSEDRNAGFSKASPHQLYLPVIAEAAYHFASRNVEVDHNRPHSLLWWMRRLINLRRQFHAFGCGTIEFLRPENGKVLAFLREYRHEGREEHILVVANLSRFAQCVELDLSRFRGRQPTELFGLTPFPPIGEWPYFLTLGPHGFYWFRLDWVDGDETASSERLPDCRIDGEWDSLFDEPTRNTLLKCIPSWLQRQRWFAGKSRKIQAAQLRDVIPLAGDSETTTLRLLLTQIDYVEGEPESYFLPVVFAQNQQQDDILGDHPSAGIVRVERADTGETAALCEASREPAFWRLLHEMVTSEYRLTGWHGSIQRMRLPIVVEEDTTAVSSSLPSIAVHEGEQSNSAAVIDGRRFMKLFRRAHSGVNPEIEIGWFLQQHGAPDCVPPLEGALEYQPEKGESVSLAVLQQMVNCETDAWYYTIDELGRYFERVESEFAAVRPNEELLPTAPLLEIAKRTIPDTAAQIVGPYLEAASLLGRRTAEMHLALSGDADDPAFAPEPFSRLSQRSLYQSMRTLTRRSLGLLRRQADRLPETLQPDAQRLLSLEGDLLQQFRVLIDGDVIPAQRIRVHGDFHLGQVLFTGRDFVIIDFEGEPDRSIGERRLKRSPLRDVAGMLRSFHYASHAVRRGQAPGTVAAANEAIVADVLEQWLQVWCAWCSATYLKSYLDGLGGSDLLPGDQNQRQVLLDLFVLEKAVYELRYELNNRPEWANIPLQGILQIIEKPQ
ncbi:maltose alpha-D-glucosyltransferase [bacterium]|nr:maltose alpha-D-glucosyltransferase [bacterium]